MGRHADVTTELWLLPKTGDCHVTIGITEGLCLSAGMSSQAVTTQKGAMTKAEDTAHLSAGPVGVGRILSHVPAITSYPCQP